MSLDELGIENTDNSDSGSDLVERTPSTKKKRIIKH